VSGGIFLISEGGFILVALKSISVIYGKKGIFMGLPAEKTSAEALQLPTTLRALVAERLIESLDLEETGEVTPEWREEIIRRCREIDEKIVELIPSETVFARAYATLK
jgi:hypothetical protein